jgi:hypothetical protein
MADANIPSRPSPADWNAAFAALPLERAPSDAWARLSASLPGREPGHASAAAPRADVQRRSRVRVGLAAAASVAFALPMAWWLGTSADAPTRSPASVVAGTASPARTSPPVRRDPGPAAVPVEAASRPATSAASAISADVHVERPRPAATASRTVPGIEPDAAVAHDGARDASHAMPAAIAATARDADADADGDADADAGAGPGAGSERDLGTASTASDEAARLAELRRESARLEALVAYARNDSMASAPVAVMSASIDDRIRLIDSALMQPGIDDVQRSSLWSERVGALQELASLEGTQRWMAAHGTSMGAVARVD